jgi:hypothetical protein
MKNKNLKTKIFHKEWQELHPYAKPASSDFYYVKLANIFLDMIDSILENSLSDKTKRTIAISIAAYFEDVISGFGLWQGFTRKHYQITENIFRFMN